jgi:hypothetical protein
MLKLRIDRKSFPLLVVQVLLEPECRYQDLLRPSRGIRRDKQTREIGKFFCPDFTAP